MVNTLAPSQMAIPSDLSFSRSRLVPLATNFGSVRIASVLVLSFVPEPEGRATTRFTAVVAIASGIILIFPKEIDAGIADARKRRRRSMVGTIFVMLERRYGGRIWHT
jgi:hypothetical protein